MNFEQFVAESPEVRARMQKQTDKLRKDFMKSNAGSGIAAAAQIMSRKAPTAIFTAAEPTADGTLDAAKKSGLYKENKSGDSSLHDWFNKSKSSDGTKGWVQLGGKYAGKPCARQPGQTTKPKCGSSKMKRDLSKKEEDKAFRRKNREDGDPDRSGKAKNVATEGVTYEKFTEEKLLNKMANDLQYAQKQTKNPFRNKPVAQQAAERKAKAQDVSKAGQFQDHNKTVKAFQKNVEPVGSTSKLRGTGNFGTFLAQAPGTTAMRGRV